MTNKICTQIKSTLDNLNDINFQLYGGPKASVIAAFDANLQRLEKLMDDYKELHFKTLRQDLLVSAKILDETGCYHPDFFSEETVRKSREKKNAS